MSGRMHLHEAGFGIIVPSCWPLHTNVSGLALAAILRRQDGSRANVGVIVADTGQLTLLRI